MHSATRQRSCRGWSLDARMACGEWRVGAQVGARATNRDVVMCGLGIFLRAVLSAVCESRCARCMANMWGVQGWMDVSSVSGTCNTRVSWSCIACEMRPVGLIAISVTWGVRTCWGEVHCEFHSHSY